VQTLRLPGNGKVGSVDVGIGHVIGVHINDNALTPEGRLDVLKNTSPGDGPAVTLEQAAFRPLERLRVLDFIHVVTGPTIGKLLTEHGADIIHCRYPYLDHILGFDVDTPFGKKNTYMGLRSDCDQGRARSCASATYSCKGFDRDSSLGAGSALMTYGRPIRA
jgi:hypothetical protein